MYPQLNLTDGQLFEGFLRVMQHQPQEITFGDRSGVFALGVAVKPLRSMSSMAFCTGQLSVK